jgi:hypothetical protein
MRKYDFDELVQVISNKKILSKVNGRVGIIVGYADKETEHDDYTYAVSFYDENGNQEEGWSISEEDLQSTGKKIKFEQNKPIVHVRVKVDPKTGEGTIIEYKENE